MQILVPKTKLLNPEMTLRRCGYGFMIDRETRAVKSFVRHLDRAPYPRFHLYLEEGPNDWHLNLHLDQRAPVYKGQTAHAGEYDGTVVENEAARIKKLLGV